MEYWKRVESDVNLFAPVTRLLRLCDSDGPSASKVYYGQYVVQEELGKLDLPFMTEAEAKACREKAHAIHMARWEYGFSPMQATGYLLDPEFRLMHDDIIIPEINEGFMKMVDKTFPLSDGPVDPCSSVDRAKHEAACEEQANKRAAAEEQVQQYLSGEGIFARESIKVNARKMAAAQWWLQYGGHLPELQKVAVRCLSQIAGAGASERGHKEMNFIKSKVRNRLTIENTEKLVYTRHNLMQLEKRRRQGFKQDLLEWYEWDMKDDDDPQDVAQDGEWGEARREAEEEFELQRESLVARAQRSVARLVVASARHIPPSLDEVEETTSTMHVLEEAGIPRASRTGRTIRD